MEIVQALLAPLTVLGTWLLARRLFDPRVPRLAVVVGALLGVGLLVRPTAFFVAAGIAAAWIVASGWRRGVALTALAGAVAALVVAPWTIRNALTEGVGFIPISVQDGAISGTFNEAAANDPDHPYQWRARFPGLERYVDLWRPTSDAEFRSDLQRAGLDYIEDQPASVPKAVFWNGLTRFWDLRPPGKALDEVDFQGRSRVVRAIGLGMYCSLLAPVTAARRTE